jgi:hypothetical protein
VIRDEKFKSAGGDRADVEALLEKIDAAAERFAGLDRVCFYARIAELLRERCGEIDDPDEILKRATDGAEQQRRAAWGPPFFFSGELRVTPRRRRVPASGPSRHVGRPR